MSDILIVEDEVIIRESLARLLRRNRHQVRGVGSVDEALAEGLDNFDLIIADIRLPGAEGTTLIEPAAPVPVLLMTSYSSVESAVDAMKQGAVDYIAKPWSHDEMLLTVERILEGSRLQAQNRSLRREIERRYPVKNLRGQSAVMQEIVERIRRVAQSDAPILVCGETGTGKELAARAIHAASPRAERPLVCVNCASIAEQLIESELFGHVRGAFTGAQQNRRGLIAEADGGTLFLDEVGELSMEAQAKLLRVIEEGEIRRVGADRVQHVDIRLISATHRDLAEMVEQKRFREDLFYRLDVMQIRMPPLRERREDILELAELFLEEAAGRLPRDRHFRLSEKARRRLLDYPWPGNVRELENVIERAVILARRDTIDEDDLGLEPVAKKRLRGIPDNLSLDEYFVAFVKAHEGRLNETELARRLGISRKNLWERRQRLGIPRR
jgi:DNA-binding NtrC family response regulator